MEARNARLQDLFCWVEDTANSIIARKQRANRYCLPGGKDLMQNLKDTVNELYKPADDGQYICDLLIRKGFTLPDGTADCPRCYKNALISSGAWSNLLSGKANFTKPVQYRMAFTLKLKPEEAEEFLFHYGFCFTPHDYRDMLVLAMLIDGVYDQSEVYAVLEFAAKNTKNRRKPVKNIYPQERAENKPPQDLQDLICRVEDTANSIIARKQKSNRYCLPSGKDLMQSLKDTVNELYKPADDGQYICDLLIRKGFTLPDGTADCPRCYKNALISSGAWSNLLSGRANFTKPVQYRMSFTLKLKPEEAEEFLFHYGFCFTPHDYRDMLVLAMLIDRIYDPGDVYAVLERAARQTRGKRKPVKNIYPQERAEEEESL